MHVNKKSKGGSERRLAKWREQHPDKTNRLGIVEKRGVGYCSDVKPSRSYKAYYGRTPRRLRERGVVA